MITENTIVIKVPRKNSILTDEYFKNSPANHKVTMPKILMIVELIEVVDEIVASFTSELKRRETLKDNAYTRATNWYKEKPMIDPSREDTTDIWFNSLKNFSRLLPLSWRRFINMIISASMVPV